MIAQDKISIGDSKDANRRSIPKQHVFGISTTEFRSNTSGHSNPDDNASRSAQWHSSIKIVHDEFNTNSQSSTYTQDHEGTVALIPIWGGGDRGRVASIITRDFFDQLKSPLQILREFRGDVPIASPQLSHRPKGITSGGGDYLEDGHNHHPSSRLERRLKPSKTNYDVVDHQNSNVGGDDSLWTTQDSSQNGMNSSAVFFWLGVSILVTLYVLDGFQEPFFVIFFSTSNLGADSFLSLIHI